MTTPIGARRSDAPYQKGPRSMRRIVLGICLVQGVLGCIVAAYADQTVNVSKSGPYTSIQQGFNVMYYDLRNYDPQTGKCTLHDNWAIKVTDDGIYDDSVLIWKVGTSPSAKLTLTSTTAGATIYPGAGTGVSALTIVETDFVTISGFTFKNHPDFPKDPTKSHAMTGFEDSRDQAPADGQVAFENCVWDGQGQTYNVKGVLLLWHPHGNITVQNCAFENCKIATDDAMVTLVSHAPSSETPPDFHFSDNIFIDNQAPLLDLLDVDGGPYCHHIVLENNDFTLNQSPFDLVTLYHQRGGNVIENNRFYGNQLTPHSLSVVSCGQTTAVGNQFLQNATVAELHIEEYAQAAVTLAGNTLAASPRHACLEFIWGNRLSLNTLVLKSYENSLYSNYNSKDGWNTTSKDYVARWNNNSWLTIDQWNAKSPTDGDDHLAPQGTPPPASP